MQNSSHAFFFVVILELFAVTLAAETAVAQSILPRRITPSEFVQFAALVSSSLPDTAPKIRSAIEEYFVVFIPGILGSKLKDPVTGNVIWGVDPKPSLQPLMVTPGGPEAKAEILDIYPTGITRQDVYGQSEIELAAVIGGRAQVEEFPYDWRQDLNQITDRLETEYFRGLWRDRLKGKRLIIVAHSMGGLVAWNWKNRYYQQGNYEFEWWRLILLGSPLRGSCEILRMLLTGYRPTPGASILESAVYSLLFSDLKPAVFTFPSAFQLLPLLGNPDSRTSCLILKTQTGEHPQNHFSPKVWEKFLFPLLKGGWPQPPIWKELKLSEQDFSKRLSSMLDNARDFRENLDRNLTEGKLSNRVVYFYSNEHPTTAQVFIDVGNKRIEEDSRGILNSGDGRVLEESATNSGNYGQTPREIRSSHGALVKDTSFISFLKDDLKPRVAQEQVKRIASIIRADPTATQGLANAGTLLALSDLNVDVSSPSTFDETTRAIMDLNLSSLQALRQKEREKEFASSNLGRNAYNYGKYYDDKRQDKHQALPLYEVAILSGALAGTVDEAYARNRLGYALILAGRFDKAKPVLEQARANVESFPSAYPDTFRGQVLNNLAVSYLRTGNKDAAISTLKQAEAFGSIKAKEHWLAIEGLERDRT